MIDLQRVVLASNNPGKLRELTQLFAPLRIQALPQSAFEVEEVDEPHATFIENALVKARHASQISGLAALADDSGICAIALNGAPGVYSARYAGEAKSDARNNAKLIEALATQSDKRVYYYCALVVVRHAADPQPLIAEGTWSGLFVDTPRGSHGFGYDPHFYLPERACTAAELDPLEKNRLSHRAQAMAQLYAKLAHCPHFSSIS